MYIGSSKDRGLYRVQQGQGRIKGPARTGAYTGSTKNRGVYRVQQGQGRIQGPARRQLLTLDFYKEGEDEAISFSLPKSEY